MAIQLKISVFLLIFLSFFLNSFSQEEEIDTAYSLRSYVHQYNKMIIDFSKIYPIEDVEFGSSHPIETYYYLKGSLDAYKNCLKIVEDNNKQKNISKTK